MKKFLTWRLLLFAGLLIVTVFFTYAIMSVDVQPIGPENTEVGFATFNAVCNDFIGFNNTFYIITQITGYLSITIALAVGICAVVQWVQRRNMFKIDVELLLYSIIVCFTFCIYVFFEIKQMNFRPVLMDGKLDPSYPSSHMMVVASCLGMLMCLMPRYFNPGPLLYVLEIVLMVIIEGTILGRILAGVHWATDIIAGLLISSTIIALDRWLVNSITALIGHRYIPRH